MLRRDTFDRIFLHHASYKQLESVWLRSLGLIYIAAFGSLWPQITGLIGSEGIAPASQLLTAVHSEIGAAGFWQVPTLFWFSLNNGLLIGACALGSLGGALLVIKKFSRTASVLCFALYLSIVVVGAPFTNFQWDALLLEAGFLAIFAGAPLLVWAYRLLLFRLMFESGVVKLLSHDPNWRNGHGLRFHFLTQPLPNPIAYYAYRLPSPMLDTMTWITLAIELGAPFLLFAPRPARHTALAFIVLLQFLILVTGNYAFFNWLTLALCLWGLDPQVVTRGWFRQHLNSAPRPASRPLLLFASLVVLGLMMIGLGQAVLMLQQRQSALFTRLTEPIAPFEIVNTYGLFAVMTTTRPEIILEGSNDNAAWREYNFPYKPGNLLRPLPWIAPYHPRLDWQMWFAALGTPPQNAWIASVCYHLLKGDKSVLHLMEAPPFATPPRYLRGVLYQYEFTTPKDRVRTGAIWQRKQIGTWYGPVSLGSVAAEH